MAYNVAYKYAYTTVPLEMNWVMNKGVVEMRHREEIFETVEAVTC